VYFHAHSGDRYVGQWVADRKSGKGSYLFKSGSRYEGSFYMGHLHGGGALKFANGASYVGEWRNSQKHGMGVFVFPNGGRYVGLPLALLLLLLLLRPRATAAEGTLLLRTPAHSHPPALILPTLTQVPRQVRKHLDGRRRRDELRDRPPVRRPVGPQQEERPRHLLLQRRERVLGPVLRRQQAGEREE